MLMSTVLTCVLRREEFILNVNFPFSLFGRNGIFPRWPSLLGLPSFSVVQELREAAGSPNMPCPRLAGRIRPQRAEG